MKSQSIVTLINNFLTQEVEHAGCFYNEDKELDNMCYPIEVREGQLI